MGRDADADGALKEVGSGGGKLEGPGRRCGGRNEDGVDGPKPARSEQKPIAAHAGRGHANLGFR